jgi:hypothetical protein
VTFDVGVGWVVLVFLEELDTFGLDVSIANRRRSSSSSSK